MNKFSLYVSLIVLVFISSCKENNDSKQEKDSLSYSPSAQEIEYQNYLSSVDNDTSLIRGNSLYYSKEDGSTMEVFINLNEEKQTVKIEELYSNAGSSSMCSNTFYFNKGLKYISRELFERGDELSGYFVERISYYDEKENPIKTIERKADFEDQLYREEFKVVENYNCSSKRALMALNQEGEFSTTFQGFIKEEPYLYLIVGDNEDNGYTSALVVQYEDQTIKKLQMYEAEMIGKGIQVEFETLSGTQGYDYQILLSTRLR